MSNQDETVRVYKRVTSIIWQRLSPTFGIRTINAIAKNSLARSAQQYAELARMKVGPDGLEWEQFETHLDQIDEERVSAMLEQLMDEFFEAISVMIGRLVVGKIFAEAEEELQKKEQ